MPRPRATGAAPRPPRPAAGRHQDLRRRRPESLAPGVYHFAVKGTMATKVYVEEYSIGIYADAESELTTSTEYYYDDDEEEYEEVIQYSASTQNFIK